MVNNVEKIFKFHPTAIVHIVDNGSVARGHLTRLRELGTVDGGKKVIIDELETSGFELGACSFAWKKYKGVHPWDRCVSQSGDLRSSFL